jgi:hypothetical protein
MHSAFQCIAAMQSPATLPALPEGTASSPSRDLFARGLLFFSPRDAAVVWWLPREDQLLKLAPGSFAAVPFQHADFGFLVAAPGDARPASPAKRGAGGAGQTPEELWYQTLRIRTTEAGLSEPSVGRQVGVVASRALPRTTNRTGGISLLFSAPRTSDQAAFDVMLLAPAKAE